MPGDEANRCIAEIAYPVEQYNIHLCKGRLCIKSASLINII